MRFDPTARLDLHQRFVEVCARELARHAAHVAFIRALRLRKPSRVWICAECQSVAYLARGGAPRCPRCP